MGRVKKSPVFTLGIKTEIQLKRFLIVLFLLTFPKSHYVLLPQKK